MKNFIRFISPVKGIIIALKVHRLLGWAKNIFLTIYNIIELSKWIELNKRKDILNDFLTLKRDYQKRYQLYKHIINQYSLKNEDIVYLEFGVFEGQSFKWWLNECSNNSFFYGFDTFEGLPENWGGYKKGEMSSIIPQIDDKRAKFIKGLFQETLPVFISNNRDILKSKHRKIIHLDADLFSSTLFVLSSLAPYLSNGDILIFDEFNVPNHEFFAFKTFTKSFYFKFELIGAVNNYFQVALIVI